MVLHLNFKNGSQSQITGIRGVSTYPHPSDNIYHPELIIYFEGDKRLPEYVKVNDIESFSVFKEEQS